MKTSRRTEWFRLHTLALQESKIPPKAGVYQIRWAINGKPRPIPRAGEIDHSGLLYVGKSSNLRRRILNFWKRIRDKKASHSAGHTYAEYNFNRKFKPEQLEIMWKTLSPNRLDEEEREALAKYTKKYLDKPPLNISLRRRY